jgi:hypothetical protein
MPPGRGILVMLLALGWVLVRGWELPGGVHPPPTPAGVPRVSLPCGKEEVKSNLCEL